VRKDIHKGAKLCIEMAVFKLVGEHRDSVTAHESEARDTSRLKTGRVRFAFN
jgi:hypothetical protein